MPERCGAIEQKLFFALSVGYVRSFEGKSIRVKLFQAPLALRIWPLLCPSK